MACACGAPDVQNPFSRRRVRAPSQRKLGGLLADLILLQPLYIMIEIDGIENIDHVQLGDPGGYDAAEEQLFVTTE